MGTEAPEYKEMKMIVVDICDTCPFKGECKPWKSVTKQQKFVLIFGVGAKKFILNGCPLPNGEDNAEATNLMIKR